MKLSLPKTLFREEKMLDKEILNNLQEFYLTWLNIHVDLTFHLRRETLIFDFVSHGKQPKIQINFVENKLSQLDNELAQKNV